MALAVSSPQEFYQIAQTGQLYDTAIGLRQFLPRSRELAYVRQTANAAFRYCRNHSGRVQHRRQKRSDLPTSNDLTEQMAIIARLIKGNGWVPVFLWWISADFDTHVHQRANHLSLLQQLSPPPCGRFSTTWPTATAAWKKRCWA
jgi:hypothetical protein